MRGIMSLDAKTRLKLTDKFEHLKIQCRAEGNQLQHQSFGDELFHKMKSVRFNFCNNFLFLKLYI